MSMPQQLDTEIAPPGPSERPMRRYGGKYTRDELMHEWEHFRGLVSYFDFPAYVDIDFRAWDRAFRRAEAAGDPRAVRGVWDKARWW